MTIHVRIVGGEHQKVQPEYLSPAGVAEYLRVNRRTVYTWIKEGYLPAIKTGPKLWAISLTDLQKFLSPGAARKAQPAQAVAAALYSTVPGRLPPAQLSPPKAAKRDRKR
jgi:excisionase family DNA binding protein